MMLNFRRNKKKKNAHSSLFENSIKPYLKPKQNDDLIIIDVGANRGDFFTDAFRIFKNNKISGVLIEPIPECVKTLKEKFSNHSNIKIINNAVSDINSNVKFYVNSYDETSSLLKIKGEMPELDSVNTDLVRVIDVQTIRLDDIFKDTPKIIDVLKIDVQGSEHKVFDGGEETCKKAKYIWTEVSFKALYEGSSTFNEVYEKLVSLGFVLVEIKDGHRSAKSELLQANCLFKNTSL